MSLEVENATLNVLADADAPRLLLGSAVGYQRGEYRIQVAPQAELRDADTFAFNGSELRVHMGAGADAGNSLVLGGPYTIDSQGRVLEQLYFEPKVIGRLISNGQGLNDLVIRFNGSANQATVQSLIRMVLFQTEPTATAGKRVLKFSFTDADGEREVVDWKRINVS
jgi:hypothetical protein